MSSQDSPEPRGPLYILVAVFAIFSAWFLSKLRTPNKESSKPVTPRDYSQEEGDCCQFEPSLVHQIAQTPKQNDYTQRRKPHTLLWEKLAAGAVAIGTIGLLIVNIFSLGASKRAAIDARKALVESEQAHVAIGRPDGTVAEIVWPKDPKAKAGIIVYFQNNGHFPAKFNWGNDSPMIAVLPADPSAIKESQYTSQWLPFETDHYFRPMWRAKNRKTGGFGWSGTITIPGNSAYEGILWELPKDRMLQLMNWDRPFTATGKFDYCNGFGHHLCRKFSIGYVRSPYNRFILVGGDECAIWEYQVLNPDPNFDYRPPCELTEEREELRGSFSSKPKP
jgi:hypothetical protein